jgi:hypothetical protein
MYCLFSVAAPATATDTRNVVAVADLLQIASVDTTACEGAV